MKIGFIGGHLTTAVAVLEVLIDKLEISKSDIVFFGKQKEAGKKSVELQTINKLGLKFVPVFAVKINRFFSLNNFLAIFIFPLTLIHALLLLLRFKVNLLISFGGNLSVPLILTGKFLGIKIIIHEGTVKAGLANRLLTRFAAKTLISFETSRKYFPKALLTGLPLRKEILEAKSTKSQVPILLISGGHLGSQKINRMVLPLMKKLLAEFIVVHQTGNYDFDEIVAFRRLLPSNLRIKYKIGSFFSAKEYSHFLANASLIISRSGINSVAEILFHGKPSILIPLPFSQNNEQLENAKLVEKNNLGIIIDQQELTSDRLWREIQLYKKKFFEREITAKKTSDFWHNYFYQASLKIAQLICEEGKKKH